VRLHPPTYEVQHGSEVLGPFRFGEIARKLQRGELEVTDTFRRLGKTEWRRLDRALERNRLGEVIFFGPYAIGFVLAGLLATWWGMKILSWDRMSAAWPTAMGRITYSNVEYKATTDSVTIPTLGANMKSVDAKGSHHSFIRNVFKAGSPGRNR